MGRHAMLVMLLAAACRVASAAEPGDPLEAPVCREAMAALEREEAAASAARASDAALSSPSRARIQAAQRTAAWACLRGTGDPPPPPRSATPPISVPRPDMPAAPRSNVPLPSTAPPGPISPPMPQTITACDAVGCWTNDGTRLQRAGPNLLGPRGYCTTTGAIVTCP
jgi:hypothetical protein